MANYLLSGGAGFLGSHFAESLLHDGHEVTILDNFTTGTLQNFDREIYERDALTIIEHDVTKPLPVDPEYDVVTHLASIPTPGEYMNRPVDTLRTGSLGTRRTLDLAVQSNATYLLTSTSEVYGDPEAHPQPESYNGDVDPFGPRSCYDEGKRYAEALTRAYRQEYGLNVRVARIFNTYGPRMRDDRVIPAFIAQAQAGDDLTIHGDGTQTRSFCYVTDLIRGFRALLKGDCQTPVNLGNPDERTIADLAEVVCDVTESESKLTHTKRPPDDPDRRCPDISLAHNRLGWSPSVELRDGIQRTVNAAHEYR